MKPREDAAIHYDPGDESGDSAPPLDRALAKARRELSNRPGVHGLGLGQTKTGDHAIIVYVSDARVKRGLPADIAGVPLEIEVTGDIEPLRG